MGCFDIRYTTSPEFTLEALTKTDDGKELVKYEPPFNPYCFVKEPPTKQAVVDLLEAANDAECTVDMNETHSHISGEFDVVKVTGQVPWDIKDFKRLYDEETFEADVPYTRRVMIDEEIQVDVPDEEDMLYFDIEVDPRGEFPDPEEADKRILSIAWADGTGDVGCICYDNEKKLIREFYDMLDEYFVISGWNSETFDWPYLKNRRKTYGIQYDSFEVVHLDLQYLFMHVNREERESFALDAVGQDEVGMEKEMREEDHPMGYEVLWHWFENDRETLISYNEEDAKITRAIDNKYKLTRIVFRIVRRGYMRPTSLMYNTGAGQVNMAVGSACDGATLNHNSDTVFNNKGKYDSHDFPGGRVFEPKPGTYTDVMTADFSGMYPAMIRDFNIGQRSWLDASSVDEAVEMARETFDDTITEDDIILGVGDEPDGTYETEGQLDNIGKARGYFIHPDIAESELASSLDEIESLRMEFKKKKKKASKGTDEWHKRNNQDRGLKVLSNSMFGVSASPDYHRYYVPGMSENITEIGQHLTSACKKWAEEELPLVEQVIYGDTDSVMFELNVIDEYVDMDGFDEYVADFIEHVGPDNELDLAIDELRACYKSIRVAQNASDKLNEFIVEYVRDVFNSPGNHMEMDLDDVYKTYLITDKKKKYAGDVVYDDGPCAYRKIKGFKCVKANTSQAVKAFQKALIEAKLNLRPTSEIIDRFYHELFTGQFDHDMVQHTRLNKMPDDYETLMAHARAAKMIIEREGDKGAIRTGDKVKYLKYGDDVTKVMPVDNGIDDFRPNEGYCDECDAVVYGDHEHDVNAYPRLRNDHYSYLWSNRFEPTMKLLQVRQFEQTTMGAFL